jgi:DNA-directed RNA polymerase specialized sigma subunit
MKGFQQDMANNYVNNEELLNEIIIFRENDVLSEKLGEMILVIAKNYSTKGRFCNYTWREDMVSEAVLTCCKYLKNFNPEKSSNAFAYVTKICHNAFKGYIKKENKHSKIKDNLFNSFREDVIYYSLKGIDYTQYKQKEE